MESHLRRKYNITNFSPSKLNMRCDCPACYGKKSFSFSIKHGYFQCFKAGCVLRKRMDGNRHRGIEELERLLNNEIILPRSSRTGPAKNKKIKKKERKAPPNTKFSQNVSEKSERSMRRNYHTTSYYESKKMAEFHDDLVRMDSRVIQYFWNNKMESWLSVPFFRFTDEGKKRIGWQTFATNDRGGKKFCLSGRTKPKMSGAFQFLGSDVKEAALADVVYIAEGLSTSLSYRKVVGCDIFIALSSGNIRPFIVDLLEFRKNNGAGDPLKIVLIGDNDRKLNKKGIWTENTGIENSLFLFRHFSHLNLVLSYPVADGCYDYDDLRLSGTLDEAQARERVQYIRMNSKYIKKEKIVDLLAEARTSGNNTLICVKSPKGSGKTSSVCIPVMKEYETGLYICPVRALAANAQKVLSKGGVKNVYEHMEILEGGSQSNRATTCINSITNRRFEPLSRDSHEVIIVDEYEQNLTSIVSGTVGLVEPSAKVTTFNRLFEIIRDAKISMVLDADLSDKSIAAMMQSFPGNVYIVENVHNSGEGMIIRHHTKGGLMEAVKSAFKKRKRCLVTTDSVPNSWEIYATALGYYKKEQVKLLNSETSSENYEFIRGISRGSYKGVEVLIHTPLTGISIDEEHFDYHFLESTGGVDKNVLHQTMLRDRTWRVFNVFVPPRGVGANEKRYEDYILDTKKALDTYLDQCPAFISAEIRQEIFEKNSDYHATIARKKDEANRSKCNLRETFRRKAVRGGFLFEYATVKDTEAAVQERIEANLAVTRERAELCMKYHEEDPMTVEEAEQYELSDDNDFEESFRYIPFDFERFYRNKATVDELLADSSSKRRPIRKLRSLFFDRHKIKSDFEEQLEHGDDMFSIDRGYLLQQVASDFFEHFGIKVHPSGLIVEVNAGLEWSSDFVVSDRFIKFLRENIDTLNLVGSGYRLQPHHVETRDKKCISRFVQTFMRTFLVRTKRKLGSVDGKRTPVYKIHIDDFIETLAEFTVIDLRLVVKGGGKKEEHDIKAKEKIVPQKTDTERTEIESMYFGHIISGEFRYYGLDKGPDRELYERVLALTLKRKASQKWMADIVKEGRVGEFEGRWYSTYCRRAREAMVKAVELDDFIEVITCWGKAFVPEHS